MRIEELSEPAQQGLREWAKSKHGDEELFDKIGSSPESWSWIHFQLRVTPDRREWLPHGKWVTLQAIEGKLLDLAALEAKEPGGTLENSIDWHGMADYFLIPKNTISLIDTIRQLIEAVRENNYLLREAASEKEPGMLDMPWDELELPARVQNSLHNCAELKHDDSLRSLLALEHPQRLNHFGLWSFSHILAALEKVDVSEQEIRSSVFFRSSPASWRRSYVK